MKLSNFVYLLLLLSAPAGLWAQSAPKYSNEFLNIGIGSRGMAMGEAQVAVTNDVTAGYWNPAGLMRAPRRHEIGLMHSEYFAGIAKFDYGALTTGIDENHRIGLSFIRMGVDDIPNTLNFRDGNSFNYSKITKFSVADMALLLTYAGKVKFVSGLNYGVNVKVVHRTVGPFATAWGFGLDLGLQYKIKGFQLGLMLKDITNTFNAWTFNTENFEQAFVSTGNVVPENNVEITLPSSTFGVGYAFFEERKINFLATFDLKMTYDGKRDFGAGPVGFDPRLGLEGSFKKIVFLRAGFSRMQLTPNDNGDKTFNMSINGGVGFQYQIPSTNLWFNIDYAIAPAIGFSQGGLSHLFTLRVGVDNFKFRQQ